jgi:hypothetical protein
MKSTTVTLASRTYTVESLKFKAEKAWRKKYDKPISDLVSAISNVKELATKEFDKSTDLLKEVSMVILKHADDLVKAMLDSPDTMLDAICDYSPALKLERTFIEENAYQDEIAKAFIEVLQIAFPFGSLLGLVKNFGQMEKQTSQNSPDPSGVSGKTS